MSISAGYAQAVITPSLDRPVYLAGFGRNRRAQSVHDDLYVRVLALGDGETLVVLAAVDLIGLARTHCAAVEASVAEVHPRVRVVVASTHTHHGPDTLGLWGPDETTRGVDEQYFAETLQTIVETILAAIGGMEEVTLRSASIVVTGVAKNARTSSVKDEELTCVQVCTVTAGAERSAGSAADLGMTGQVLATLAIYPCHPEVLWDENPHITSDYLAALRTSLEEATGAPALAVVGALGGMMTPDLGANTFEAAAHMGRVLGQAGAGALAGMAAGKASALGYWRDVLALPLANPLFHLALGAGLLEGELHADGTLTSECSLLRIGDTSLLFVPGELLPRLGLAYKEAMRATGARVAAVVGLANDEIGYILPEDEFIYPANPLEPGDHYEETMSLGPETAPLLSAAVERLVAAAGGVPTGVT
jgi:hypothetical protein